MDSPIEPVSPADSSGSDTPLEEHAPQTQESNWFSSSLSKVGFGGKRRLPGGGPFGPTTSSRDTKSRRREDHAPKRLGGLPYILGGGDPYGAERVRGHQKEELVDTQLVEVLRRRAFIPPQPLFVTHFMLPQNLVIRSTIRWLRTRARSILSCIVWARLVLVVKQY